MRKLVLYMVKNKSLFILVFMLLVLLLQVIFVHGAIKCSECWCSCDDSDGGDIYTKGWAQQCGEKYDPSKYPECQGWQCYDPEWDQCINSVTVREYWCNNQYLDYTDFYCANGCVNGACLTTPILCCDYCPPSATNCGTNPALPPWIRGACGSGSCTYDLYCGIEGFYATRVINPVTKETQRTSPYPPGGCYCKPSKFCGAEIAIGSTFGCDTPKDDASSYASDNTMSCCDNANDCVWNNNCYYDGGPLPNMGGPAGADARCWNGFWEDCDRGQTVCENSAYCGYGAGRYIAAGESGVGEYDAQGGGSQCCGDDSGEYLITAGIGPDRCCNAASDCVDSGGVCRGGTEVCNNGIDDNCDGSIDEDCCTCTDWRNLDPGCGIEGCLPNQMKQTRDCPGEPPCDIENQCVDDTCTPWVKRGCCAVFSANQIRDCAFGCDIEQRCFADFTCICIPGQTGDCEKQDGVCAGSQQTCTNFNWPVCSDADYLAYNSSYENPETTTDDWLDNDCDGLVDEKECPVGQYTYRKCAFGVCTTDENDWNCTDNPDDYCVFNRLIYSDLDRVLADNPGMTKDDLKDPMSPHHDSVYHEINPDLPGEEYCDPGTWYSEGLENAAIIEGSVYNLDGTTPIEDVWVTALPGIPLYEDYTDDFGVYSMIVTGDAWYYLGVSKTNYITQTTSVYTVAGETNTTNFNLRYNSWCDSDCSRIEGGIDDNKCHKECDGDPNGCKFYDSLANETCNGKGVEIIMQYSPSPDLDIVCCEGMPYSPIKAVTKVNTTGNVVTIRKPVWYGGKLVNMVITFFD